MAQKYPNITKILKGVKGLTENEVKVYFEICKKDSVSVKEMLVMFQKLTKKISKGKVYNIVEKYKCEGLIFLSGDSGRARRYRAIHPKALFNDIKESLGRLDNEIAMLSEAYEVHDFEIKDPRKRSKTLNSEPEILTVCNAMCRNSELLVVSKNTPEFETFYNSLSKIGRVINGDIDLILFNDHNNDDKGIITLTKRPSKDGSFRIFGQIIYDEDKYKYFYEREVGRNGKDGKG